MPLFEGMACTEEDVNIGLKHVQNKCGHYADYVSAPGPCHRATATFASFRGSLPFPMQRLSSIDWCLFSFTSTFPANTGSLWTKSSTTPECRKVVS